MADAYEVLEDMVEDEEAIEDADYHAIRAFSNSGAKYLLKSIKHYLAWLERPKEAVSDAMAFGTAYHMAVLEPLKFHVAVVQRPAEIKQRRGKDWEAYVADNNGKLILRPGEKAKITDMITVLMQKKSIWPLLAGEGWNEKAYQWEDYDYKFPCKCKIDRLTYDPDQDIFTILDLKRTPHASYSAWPRHAAQMQYDIQAAFYLEAVGINERVSADFRFITQEPEPPFEAVIHRAQWR